MGSAVTPSTTGVEEHAPRKVTNPNANIIFMLLDILVSYITGQSSKLNIYQLTP